MFLLSELMFLFSYILLQFSDLDRALFKETILMLDHKVFLLAVSLGLELFDLNVLKLLGNLNKFIGEFVIFFGLEFVDKCLIVFSLQLIVLSHV